jgi:hypothetical protein
MFLQAGVRAAVAAMARTTYFLLLIEIITSKYDCYKAAAAASHLYPDFTINSDDKFSDLLLG